MPLRNSNAEPEGRVRRRLEKLRRRYRGVISEAEHFAGGRLEEFRHLVDQLSPSIRGLIDERVNALQAKLDDINQRLAEEAVPDERKTSVGRLALERKAASAARAASSVVKSRRRKPAAQKPESPADDGRAGKPAKGAGSRKKSGE